MKILNKSRQFPQWEADFEINNVRLASLANSLGWYNVTAAMIPQIWVTPIYTRIPSNWLIDPKELFAQAQKTRGSGQVIHMFTTGLAAAKR
jgi:hypothetical protein